MECACRDGIIESAYDVATKTDDGEGIFALVLTTGKEEEGPGLSYYKYSRQGRRQDMQ